MEREEPHGIRCQLTHTCETVLNYKFYGLWKTGTHAIKGDQDDEKLGEDVIRGTLKSVEKM